MQVWRQFLIAVLVALALPVQGLANAVMLNCGPSHQRMQAVVSGHAAHAQHAEHAHHDSAAPPHSQAAHHADTAAVAGDDAGSPDTLTDLGQFKCSACASCCSGLALLRALPQVPAPDAVATVFVAVRPSVGASWSSPLTTPVAKLATPHSNASSRASNE